MSHFASVARVPGDPILSLMEAYRQDRNAAKLDLGVGVYKDAQGPVSYTHLDVYKRQFPICAMPKK